MISGVLGLSGQTISARSVGASVTTGSGCVVALDRGDVVDVTGFRKHDPQPQLLLALHQFRQSRRADDRPAAPSSMPAPRISPAA
jgi:hypothetical protein